MSASTDPIADFLTRIRNAIQAAHETVDIPSSKLKVECARILAEQAALEQLKAANPEAYEKPVREPEEQDNEEST